jgi:hypothetical protein
MSSGVARWEIRISPGQFEIWGAAGEDVSSQYFASVHGEYSVRSVVEALADLEGGTDDPIRIDGAEGVELFGAPEERALASLLIDLSDEQLDRLVAEEGTLSKVRALLDIATEIAGDDSEGWLGSFLDGAPEDSPLLTYAARMADLRMREADDDAERLALEGDRITEFVRASLPNNPTPRGVNADHWERAARGFVEGYLVANKGLPVGAHEFKLFSRPGGFRVVLLDFPIRK